MFRFQGKPVEEIFWVKTCFSLLLFTYMFPKHSDYLIRKIIPNKILYNSIRYASYSITIIIFILKDLPE